MSAHPVPKIDVSQFSPPRPMEEYPRDSILKIAVLFTDIVGSTSYFKDQGDIAGREMLQNHEDIASPPIVEHAGIILKTLGDSVMAYFTDPKEAVKELMTRELKVEQE